MSKALVMYFSKYGTTKKYAEWIAAELGGDVFDYKKVKSDIMQNYDIIVLGSGLYAGSIRGLGKIIDNYEKLKNKKLILFTCGLADYSKDENKNSIFNRIVKIVPEDILKNIKIFYLRGGINYGRLSFIHKTMMGFLAKAISRRGEDRMSEEDREFMRTYGKTLDFTDKNTISEILQYCRE